MTSYSALWVTKMMMMTMTSVLFLHHASATYNHTCQTLDFSPDNTRQGICGRFSPENTPQGICGRPPVNTSHSICRPPENTPQGICSRPRENTSRGICGRPTENTPQGICGRRLIRTVDALCRYYGKRSAPSAAAGQFAITTFILGCGASSCLLKQRFSTFFHAADP